MAAYLIATLLGACVGTVLGLTGAGGAVLSVPLLTLVVGLPLVAAAPIGLLAVAMSAGLSAAIALRRGMLRYRAASLMAAAGAIVSPFGVALAHVLPDPLLNAVLAVLLYWIGLGNWRAARMPPGAPGAARDPPCRVNPATGKFRWTFPCARMLAATGLSAGFLSGLLGVGGGFIIVPSLRRYTDLPMAACIATSMGTLTLVSAVSVAASALHAPLKWGVAVPFVAGALIGVLLARHWSARLSGTRLQLAFALLCLCVASAMVVSLAWALFRAG